MIIRTIIFTTAIVLIILLNAINISAQNSSKLLLSQQKYLKEITSLTDTNYKDLEFLSFLLSDKQFVFIGECNHYSSEQYLLKSRIVKYLHKDLGFNVLMHEGKIGTISFFNSIKTDTIAIEKLIKYFISYFPCYELEGLVRFSQYSNLFITGFDIWLDEPYMWYPAVRKYFNLSESTFYKDSVFYDMLTTSSNQTKEVIAAFAEKRKTLSKELSLLWQNEANLVDLDTINDIIQKCIYKSMLVKSDYYLLLADGRMSVTIRDSMMTETFLWLISNIFQNEKIIIWAYNGHIMKHNPYFYEKGIYKGMSSNIGNIFMRLPNEIKEKSYVLGIYGYEGELKTDKFEFKVNTPNKNSLCSEIMKSGYNIAFCNIKNEPLKIFSKKTRFNSKLKYIPKESFDGIIVIRSINAFRQIKQ